METARLPVCMFGQVNLEAMKTERNNSWNIMHEDDLVFLGTLPQAFSHSELNLFPYVFHSFAFKIKIIGSESPLMSGESMILFIVISAQ